MELRHPIMIVGVPRSGTSLLTATLNNHPNLYISPESHYFFYVWGNRKIFGDLNKSQNFEKLLPYFESLKYIGSGWANTEIDTSTLRDKFFELEEKSYENLFLVFMELLAREKNKKIFGEKTPLHLYFLPTILRFYNNVKIIHVVRDARAVVSSLLGTNWGKDLIIYSLFWKNCIGLIQKFKNAAQGNILEIKFEEMVEKPTKILSEICEFLEVPYFSSILDVQYINTSSENAKKSYTKGFDRNAISRWKLSLSEKEISVIESITKNELLLYGFELNDQVQLVNKNFTFNSLMLRKFYHSSRNKILRSMCDIGFISLFNSTYKIPIRSRS